MNCNQYGQAFHPSLQNSTVPLHLNTYFVCYQFEQLFTQIGDRHKGRAPLQVKRAFPEFISPPFLLPQ